MTRAVDKLSGVGGTLQVDTLDNIRAIIEQKPDRRLAGRFPLSLYLPLVTA